MNKSYKICLALFWALLNAFSLEAQQNPQPYLLHWTESDGLSGNDVYEVVKDDNGWLWVGTSNGLCRFDGQTFEIFQYDPKDPHTVSANQVIKLKKVSNGNVWIGTDGGGLNIYDQKSQRFISLRQDLEQADQGLTEDRVYSFWETKEKEMLIGYRAIGSGQGGLSILTEDARIKEHVLRNQRDYAGFPMKVTHILQGTQNKDVFWLAGRSFFQWNRQTGKCIEFPHSAFRPNYSSICGIRTYNDSTLLIGLYDGGLWLFNIKSNTWETVLHKQPVNAILKTIHGQIWAADNKGVGYWDREKEQFNYVLLLDGKESLFPKNTRINSIAMIDENLWISTNNGLFCWNAIFEQFKIGSLKINETDRVFYPEFIDALAENEWLFLDQKRGLILTDSLLQVKKKVTIPGSPSVRKAVVSKHSSNPFILLGAARGLYQWEPEDAQLSPLTIANAGVDISQLRAWSMYADSMGSIWVGTQTSGLVKIDRDKNEVLQFLSIPNDSLSLCHDKYLFEIDKDSQGNLWICTDKGVSIIDPKTNQFLRYPNMDKIKNFVIHAVEIDLTGNVWIGTRDQGLFEYDSIKKSWTQYSISDGLLYNGVNKLLLKDSILWFSTRGGLGNINTVSKVIKSFDRKKGLYRKDLSNSRLKLLPNQAVMLTYQYTDYFSTFYGPELMSALPPPKTILKSVRVLSSEKQRKIAVIPEQTIHLGPYENYFAIDFQGVHFLQARGLTYKYQLTGYDDQWITAENTNTAVYTNLPGGNYRFSVKTMSKDKRSSAIQYLNLVLARPWFKTWWFFLSIATIVIGIVKLVYRFRIQQIKKAEQFKQQLAETEMKALRSQISPHFIFNCLNSIKGYIIDNRIEDGTTYVSRFAQLIRMILNHSKEKLIPISKEVEAIRLYIWLEQERLNHKFEASIDLNFESAPDTLLIPPLLFQPFVENAIWHGLMNLDGQGQLEIKIEEKEKHLIIQIKDNGIGRAKAEAKKQNSVFQKPSVGLEISQGRFDQMNKLYPATSELKIEDQFPGEEFPGTLVTITFPKLKTNTHA